MIDYGGMTEQYDLALELIKRAPEKCKDCPLATLVAYKAASHACKHEIKTEFLYESYASALSQCREGLFYPEYPLTSSNKLCQHPVNSDSTDANKTELLLEQIFTS